MPKQRKLSILGALGLAVLLSGCGVDQALDRIDREEDQQACTGFGFQPGTDAFATCMQRQSVQRASDLQRLLDRMALERAVQPRR